MSVTYYPSAIHSSMRSSPLTRCTADLTPEGVRMEGLLSRIALAEGEQQNKENENRMRAFKAIESRDTASRKSPFCLSWVKKNENKKTQTKTHLHQDSCHFSLKWI